MSGACDRCPVAQHVSLSVGECESDRPESVTACTAAAVEPVEIRAEDRAGAVAEQGAEPSTDAQMSAPSAIPGMSVRELDRLLRPVLVADGSHDSSDTAGGTLAEDRFARAALGTAIEPGDLEAGRLIRALGPVRFLRAIVDGMDASRLLAEVRSGDERDEGIEQQPSTWGEEP